jgi:hypothetical protein
LRQVDVGPRVAVEVNRRNATTGELVHFANVARVAAVEVTEIDSTFSGFVSERGKRLPYLGRFVPLVAVRLVLID